MPDPNSFQEENPNPGYGGGGDIFSSLINLGSAIYVSEVSKKNNRDTIKANKELAQYSYNKDLEMWNRQNQYNDPASQMERFKAAGLNPNMIYGGGSGNAGNAQTMPKYNAPTVKYDYNPINLPQVIGAYQDFRVKQAQIDNINANTAATQTKTLSEASRKTLLDMQGKIAETKAWTSEYQAPHQNAIVVNAAQASEAKLREEWQKLRLLDQQELQRDLQMQYMRKQLTIQDIDREKKEAELIFQQYKNQWTKAGITSGDNIMLRILVRMFNESGLNASDLFGN